MHIIILGLTHTIIFLVVGWRDVTGREERLPPAGLALLDRLFAEVRSARPDLKGLGDQGPGDTPLGQRRKKTTIKQLFTAASKFQKHLRRL